MTTRNASHNRLAVGAVLLTFGCGSGTGDSEPSDEAPVIPQPAQESPPESVHEPLPDEAAARGLDHVNVSGSAAKELILDANGAGVALLDLGGDGDLDVVFAQGCASLEAWREGGARLDVFENDGRGHFTRAAGPDVRGWWTGLATGDLDGDGDADLVVGGYGALTVLLQDAEGRLVPGDPLPESTPQLAPRWTTSLALLDVDGDGALDLFVGRYLDLDPNDPPRGALGEGPLAVPCEWRGHGVYCGPRGLDAQADVLFLGQGDGTFVSANERLPSVESVHTLGVVVTDADGDLDPDLVVAADSAPNRLFVNEGGRFADFGYESGVALGPDGQREAGMGVAAGDVDGDGRPDLAITNFSDEPTRLLVASEVGFVDTTHRAGLARETRRVLSWGVHLVDFDGDGRRELFTANGHVYPQADLPHTGTSYAQPDGMWRLGARATPIAAATERSVLHAPSASRGSAVGDVDGDGRPDLVISRIDGPAALAMNRFEGANWLELRLAGSGAESEGRRTPRDATGARVVVAHGATPGTGGERAQLFEVTTSGSYQSASTPFLHVGLGADERYERLSVRWPSGRVEDLGAGVAGRRLWIVEGRGVVREEALAQGGAR